MPYAGEPGARLRVKGRRPLLAAIVIDSVGTGMFLPFTVLVWEILLTLATIGFARRTAARTAA